MLESTTLPSNITRYELGEITLILTGSVEAIPLTTEGAS